MIKFYMNIELEVEKIIFKYKQKMIIIYNTKKRDMPR